MSRYLDYADPTLELERVLNLSASRPAPPGLWFVLFTGPEQVFRHYLRRESYRGLSFVALGGRLAVGQLWPDSIRTAVLIFVPLAAYWTYVRPRMHSRLLDVTQGIELFLIVTSFCLAVLTNPGICPRNKEMPSVLQDFCDVNTGRPNPRFLRVRNLTIKQNFCNTCMIFRPPRSKHCQYCDNCVLRFDHHCTWLGNCIGLYNYRFYVCLLYSGTLFLMQAIYSLFCVIYSEMHARFGEDSNFLTWLETCGYNPLWVALLGYCMLMMIAVLMLSIYHTAIMSQNLTTNEHVKSYYTENPFDMGWKQNCWQIHFRPERVLAEGPDELEVSYRPFGTYTDGLSFEDS